MKLLPHLKQKVLIIVQQPDDGSTTVHQARVQDLLALQFTAKEESGTVHYRFYADYKDTWLLPETPAQTQAREMREWNL